MGGDRVAHEEYVDLDRIEESLGVSLVHLRMLPRPPFTDESSDVFSSNMRI